MMSKWAQSVLFVCDGGYGRGFENKPILSTGRLLAGILTGNHESFMYDHTGSHKQYISPRQR